MALDPNVCGQQVTFNVPALAPRVRAPRVDWAFWMFALVGLVVLRNPILLVPWLVALSCAKHARPKLAPPVPGRVVLLGRRALHFEGRVYQLGSSPIWIERGETLVLSRRKHRQTIRVDLRGMDVVRRHELALRLDARQKLARRPRVPNGHAIALEAMHVHGAFAVRVRDHVVRQVWPRGAPWSASDPSDVIYARENVPTAGNPYRAPHPNVVVLNAL
jgi:hypothetical protein